MAKELDDGEFWLPPQFLVEDDIDIDCKKTQINGSIGDKFGGFYPYDFPYGGGFCSSGTCSDLSSPVESVVGSTEMESDEDDYIAELTRKIANSTLQDDIWKSDSGFGCEERKPWVMSGSPQSTLCGCKQGSSRGSPTLPAKMASPPAKAEVKGNDAAWDLLYAAAGEVARMKIAEEASRFYHNRGVLGAPRKPNGSTPLQSSNAGFYTNPPPQSYQQLQVAQFQQMKQQQMLKNQNSGVWGQAKANNGQFQQEQTHQMVQNKTRAVNGRPLNLSPSAWPTLQQSQQNPGSGMRAVFLGDPVTKRECAGTGVFLPRRVGNPVETRKKPGCSTVLLPDRVVQALNLNLKEMESARLHPQSRYTGNFPSDFDVPMKYRNNNAVMAQQRRNYSRPQPVINNEVRLPQEWTY